MSDNENHNMLLRRNNNRLLRIEIINSFIFIKVFKNLFLTYLIIFGNNGYIIYSILNKNVLMRSSVWNHLKGVNPNYLIAYKSFSSV